MVLHQMWATSHYSFDLQAKILSELEADSVFVKDTYGDGKHVSIDVVSNSFEGLSSMKRQRLVYKVHNL